MPAEEVHANPPPHPRDEFARGMIGRVIDDFEIRREIGRGGMGVVYEARQVSLDRIVAVKVLTASIGTSGVAVERFRREAQAAAKLHHANIVPVYAQGQADGTYYYAMELIRGRSVHEIIEEARGGSGPGNLGATKTQVLEGSAGTLTDSASASWKASAGRKTRGDDTSGGHELGSGAVSATTIEEMDNIARLTATVAEALQYAHQAGVIHRDIKPHNLMLGSDGRLCVSDFGLARIREQPGLTMTSEFLGSPLYMSAEQVSGAAGRVDHRTDIYSLGVTLYEWLTLRPPFQGQRRDQVVAQILNAEPASPRAINPLIPVALDTICLKAIQRDPNHRYQTAADMAADLRAYVQRRAIKARPPGVWTRSVKFAQRRQVALLAACLVLVSGLFAVSKYRDWSPAKVPTRTLPVATPGPATPSPQPPLQLPIGDMPAAQRPVEVTTPAGPEQASTGQASASVDWMKALKDGAGIGDELREALGVGAGDDSLAAQLDAFERYVAGELADELASFHVLVADSLVKSAAGTPADDAFRAAVESTNDELALSHLDRALELDPGHYFARDLRAVVLCRMFRFPEMVEEAKLLVEAQPEQARSHMVLGTSLLLTGGHQRALEELTRTGELLEEDPTPWQRTLRGLCYARQERFGLALREYNQAIALDSEHAMARFARGKAHAYTGGYDSALIDAEEVVQLLPDSAEAYAFRGECYDHLGQYERAHKDYAKAMDLGGDKVSLITKQLLAALNLEKQQEERAAAQDTSSTSPQAQATQPASAPDSAGEPEELSALERLMRALGGSGKSGRGRQAPDKDGLPVP